MPDVSVTKQIHAALFKQDLLPQQHLVDMGYTEIELLLTSEQKYALEVIGPLRPDGSWQSLANAGFGSTHFKVDWDNQVVTCPKGKSSKSWLEREILGGRNLIHVKFSRTDCSSCEARLLCTRSAGQRREVSLLPKDQYEAIQQIRQYQQSEEFKEAYALRAGVEATLSQGIRTLGLRRSRYKGMAKTHFQHLVTATAVNVVRATKWLVEGVVSTPSSQFGTGRTPLSRFGALAPTS